MIKMILTLLALLLLVSCSPDVPDVFVFEYLNQQLGTDPSNGHIVLVPSAVCMKAIQEPACCHGLSIVKKKEIFIGENANHTFAGKSGPMKCSDIQAQSILVPAKESYAPLLTYIINSCKQLSCDPDVEKFKVNVGGLSTAKAAQ